jgi:hypothetical protein
MGRIGDPRSDVLQQVVAQNHYYVKARQAILDCVKHEGWKYMLTESDNDSDPEMLTTHACATVILSSLGRKAPQDIVAAAVGRRWKALKRFPERIERMAREMDTLNEYSLLTLVDATVASREMARESLQDVPHMMRMYADALREPDEGDSTYGRQCFRMVTAPLAPMVC